MSRLFPSQRDQSMIFATYSTSGTENTPAAIDGDVCHAEDKRDVNVARLRARTAQHHASR